MSLQQPGFYLRLLSVAESAAVDRLRQLSTY